MRRLLLIVLAAAALFPAGCRESAPGAGGPHPAVIQGAVDGRPMVLVPAGEFIMGTDRTDPENTHLKIGTVKPLYVDQHPQRRLHMDAYYIDQYEVTNRDYLRFIEATRYSDLPTHWEDGVPPPGLENHPVTNISWAEALAYALWAGKTLPTEAQWEKAARGTDGRLYPWGNEYTKGVANIGLDAARQSAAIGSYPGDVSPFQAFDMAGNVMEWTLDWYDAYPGNDFKFSKFGQRLKVLRGNGFQKGGHYFLDAYRYVFYRTEVDPDEFFENVGFRCVLPLPPAS